MATLYERPGTDVIWCWGRDRTGKRWYRSTKQRDKRAAAVAARAIEAEILAAPDHASHKASEKSDTYTLGDALDLMIEGIKKKKRSPATIEIAETKSRHLLRLLGTSKRCSEITLLTTTEYAGQRMSEGASAHTAQKEIKALLQGLRRAQKLGLLSHKINPSLLMPDELEGAYVPRERWLGHDDLELLLSEVADHRKEYVLTFAWTGVRLSELHALRPEHYDRKRNELFIDGTEADPKTRRIPLAPVVKRIIERRVKQTPRGEPLFPTWHTMGRDLDAATLRIEKRLNPGWERPQGRAGHAGKGDVEGKAPKRDVKGRPPPKKDRVHPPVRFPSVSANDLRRSFASWLASSGVPLLHAKELMGHASTKMLEHVYARLAPQSLHGAIATIATKKTVTNAVTASARSAILGSGQRGRANAEKRRKTG